MGHAGRSPVFGLGLVFAIVGVVVLLALSALQATMQGVYAAALYRHATHPDTAVPGFAPGPRLRAVRMLIGIHTEPGQRGIRASSRPRAVEPRYPVGRGGA